MVTLNFLFTEPRKKLISVLFGISGIYVAIFWIADAKYGNAISRLDARTTNLVTRLKSEQWRKAIELVPNLQNRKIPSKPNFFSFSSVIRSLCPVYDEADSEVIEELQGLIVSKKKDLSNLMLRCVILEKLDFSESNLKNSDLQYSSLKFSDFSASILNYSHLGDSCLENVNFADSEFQGAILNGSNMEGCVLTHAKMFGTKLQRVNLNNSNLSSANLHLSDLSGSTVYNTDLSYSNLVGVDFENARGLSSANLSKAKYNSRYIEQGQVPFYKEVMLPICDSIVKKEGSIDYDDCKQEVMKSLDISYGPPTKFPEDFDPKAHGMIDVSELLANVKNN